MLATVIALALAQTAATTTAAVDNAPGWNIASSDQGCAVHSSHRGGTMLSMFVLPGQQGIGFLLQNRAWTSLENSAVYPINISFRNGEEWPVRAIARTDIDESGPGLFFVVTPGRQSRGNDFMSQFAAAGGMDITHNGAAIDRLSL